MSLYGQCMDHRPFAGRWIDSSLEIAVVPTTSITSNTQTLEFTYGSLCKFDFHDASTACILLPEPRMQVCFQNKLTRLFAPCATPLVNEDRGNTISVTKHYSSTPAKIGGSIHQSSRVIYDITIPVSMAGHADNGGLTALTVAFKHTDAADTEFVVTVPNGGQQR